MAGPLPASLFLHDGREPADYATSMGRHGKMSSLSVVGGRRTPTRRRRQSLARKTKRTQASDMADGEEWCTTTEGRRQRKAPEHENSTHLIQEHDELRPREQLRTAYALPEQETVLEPIHARVFLQSFVEDVHWRH